MTTINLLYFAGLRDIIGISEETISRTDNIVTVADLFELILKNHSDKSEVIKALPGLRCALDQTLVSWDQALGEAKEVAFFPPMTGG